MDAILISSVATMPVWANIEAGFSILYLDTGTGSDSSKQLSIVMHHVCLSSS